MALNFFNYDECSKVLDRIVSENLSITYSMFLYYFPGEFPFISGTLEPVYFGFSAKNKKIFVILMRHISTNILNSHIHELCNISSESQKLLLSPLYDSTELQKIIRLTHPSSNNILFFGEKI